MGKEKNLTIAEKQKITNHIIFTNPSARAGYDTSSIFEAEF